jgi:hypothetical protein
VPPDRLAASSVDVALAAGHQALVPAAPLLTLSLHESPRLVGIRDADSSWDQSRNHVRAGLVVRTGGAYPHLDSVVEHSGNVVHANKRSLGDEIA